MFSTASSKVTPSFITVALKGYKFTITTSIVPILSFLSCSICSSLSLTANNPACTAGCSVFTRPSRHSGKFVILLIFTAGMPASQIALYVPPVLTISYPIAASRLATCSIPLLSDTLISALFFMNSPPYQEKYNTMCEIVVYISMLFV